mmetsp:Transcript_17659/g.70897  ORF Transcript_17659/g.70897 Transcript_17659/m.70897 type:complete len:85 (-) Transcript_17659:242-496(-)
MELFATVEHLPPKLSKKVDALAGTVKKLEMIEYDLALSRAYARRQGQSPTTSGSGPPLKRPLSTTEPTEPPPGKDDDGDEDLLG